MHKFCRREVIGERNSFVVNFCLKRAPSHAILTYIWDCEIIRTTNRTEKEEEFFQHLNDKTFYLENSEKKVCLALIKILFIIEMSRDG